MSYGTPYRSVPKRSEMSLPPSVSNYRKPRSAFPILVPVPERTAIYVTMARAHDVAVLAMRGRSACLNFADSVWRLPIPESCNAKDIQKTAAEAAEAFGKIENEVEIEDEVVEIEEIKILPEAVVYYDEEEMFEMPEFIASMAEGLMVPAPQMMGYGDFMDNMDFCADVALWSY